MMNQEQIFSIFKTLFVGGVGLFSAILAAISWQQIDMFLTLLGKSAALGVSMLTMYKLYRSITRKPGRKGVSELEDMEDEPYED